MPKPKINFGFDRFSGLYVWALFIVAFGILSPAQFLSLDTAHFIGSQQAIAAMLALAILMPLACGAYDLSIGANINLAAVLVSILQVREGMGMVQAILVAVIVGLVIGFVNGLIVVKLHVSSFIATLGMATIVAAVMSIVSDNLEPMPVIDETWTNLTQHTVLGFQVVFWYLVVMAVILWWVLEHMPIGRYTYAVGSSPEAARLSGIRVGRYTWIALTVSGGVSAFAGVCYASLAGPSLTFGPSLLLPAYAAAFLGSTQLKPGRFNVWGAMIAVYVLATGVYGIQLQTSVQWLNNMFNGLALIFAVSFAVWRQRVNAARGSGHDEVAALAVADEDHPEASVASEDKIATRH